AAGRNTYHFFTDSMNREMARRVAVEDALRLALKKNELLPVFQPLVELSSGRIAGAEVLLRWHSQSLGPVSPMDFIPVAEQTGMIEPIGDFVMEQACRQAALWRGIVRDDIYISINVSPRQFRNPDMPNNLQALCDKYALPVSAVVVEITEGVLLSNQQHVLQALDDLRQRGVRIAMDDFGTGYASLSYLREYPFDILKIDRSFVGDCTNNTKDGELVVASLRLAAGLGLQAIAEGVETEAQLAFLRSHDCPMAQGYLFSRPVKAEAMTELMTTGLPKSVFEFRK
ncbi:MAG TPA: EAL domain-containing protein, partial [Gammaproteobacteria bacterium]|nr:EAL domain-containing protein [Gammaproteobacteria bacterium]